MPKPAGAETSISFDAAPRSSRSLSRGRGTQAMPRPRDIELQGLEQEGAGTSGSPGWPAAFGGVTTWAGAGGAGWAERRVLGQDAGLEFPQGLSGVDAQLVGQASTDFCVGAQGLGLPSAPVQGQDEQFPETFAQRVFPAQGLQFAGELAVAAQAQVGSGPGFDRHQGQLV